MVRTQLMNGTFNSWPSQTYLPAGVPDCPQQCSAWYLRDKHPSQTCSCLPDRALDRFGKQKLAYKLLKTFPGVGPLTASIWAVVTWMTGDRCRTELDCS